jgi:hypothetical protein
MRPTRTITVAVSADLYRQTRHIAAEYDSTVTNLVAFVLENLPRLLKLTNYGVKLAAAKADLPSATPTLPVTDCDNETSTP